MVSLEKPIGVDIRPHANVINSISNFRKYVLLTALFLGVCWFMIEPIQQHDFDYGMFYGIDRDPVGDPIGKPTLDPSSEHLHIGSEAMVSCDVPLCSSMGKSILLKGGNAADAAVTVALCIGSVNLHSSGIGGGGYIVSSMLERDEVISIDAREMAPTKAFKEMYGKSFTLSKIGGLAIGVPGELKGLQELYTRHGSGNFSWAELLEPVIELNKEGFRCSEILHNSIENVLQIVFTILPRIAENWDFVFKKDGSTLIGEGDTITRPALARTLSMIAKNGSADPFYDPEGPIVQSLVKTSQKLGGIITKEDFAKYNVNVEKALELNFTVHNETYKVYTSNGASSGLALVAGLNLYNKLYHESSPSLDAHKEVECMKWMASARSNFGDFTIHESNRTFRADLVDRFLSDEWSSGIITNGNYSSHQTFPWSHYHPKYELSEPHGTSHFSVLDSLGNSVGMTTTINLVFGSMVYDNTTGILLNNEMDDFSIPSGPNAFNLTPSVYNYIEPYKRPLSSCAPTIIMSQVNGSFHPDLLIGAAGGSRITTAVFQAIVRIIYNKVPLLHAIALPRLHHQLIPEYIMVEDLTMLESYNNVTSQMRLFGHDFFNSGPLTAMNGVKRVISDSHVAWQGVADYWRKRGEADGY